MKFEDFDCDKDICEYSYKGIGIVITKRMDGVFDIVVQFPRNFQATTAYKYNLNEKLNEIQKDIDNYCEYIRKRQFYSPLIKFYNFVRKLIYR